MSRTPSILRATTIILAFLSLGANAQAEQTTGPVAPPEATAAVYELLFADNASALQGDAAAFCIGTGTGEESADPEPSVLALLSETPKVRPASDCVVEEAGSAVVLKDGGGNALLFGAEATECLSDTECFFLGSYYEGNLSSQTNIYAARHVDGAWKAELVELGPVAFTAAPAAEGETSADEAN